MMYRNQPALWEVDFSGEGFQWLDLEDRNNSIISFARYGKDHDNHLVGFLIILRKLSLITRLACPKIAGIGNYFVRMTPDMAVHATVTN